MRKEIIPTQLGDANFEHDLQQLGLRFLNNPGYTKFSKYNAKMLEVGAFCDERLDVNGNQEFWGMEYYAMNLEGNNNPRFIQGDITNCPHIPDNSFDFVYSIDTFEHINKPWLAAKEMMRITKPGGLVYVITLFAWRYHKAPEDYFRYTPFGLWSLFDELEPLELNFDGKNRRGLNGIGTQGDGTAGDIVPIDMLGAWRENWRVYFLGRKK